MSSTVETKEMAALGRPFEVGMLYDCRSNELIEGVTLWDPERIKEGSDPPKKQETSQFEIIAEDSIQNKLSSLNVEASLSFEAMGGLIDISGSAKYLKDSRKSSQQARVTLHYSMTSHVEKLNMNALATTKIQHRDIFDIGVATHVVTGVEYGARAFFVFDQQCSSSETVQKVSGKLHVLVKKIPTIKIEGDGKLDINDEDKENAQKFGCTFISDVNLDELPSSYKQAIQAYHCLPDKIRGGAQPGENPRNVVPQKVWLYPLCKLDSRAAKFVREIDTILVTKAQQVVESLQEAERKVVALQKTEASKCFLKIKDQLVKFEEKINEYKLQLVTKEFLPLVRKIQEGTKQEADFEKVLSQHEKSPYVKTSLFPWLKEKEQEIKSLDLYIKPLSKCEKIQFATSMGELQLEMLEYNVGNLVCLELVVPQNYDSNGTLKEMILHQSDGGARQDDHQQSERYPHDLIPNMIQSRKNFQELVNSDATRVFEELAALTGNKDCHKYANANYSEKEEELKFIVLICNDSEEPKNPEEYGAKIVFYHQGRLEKFQEPSRPAKPHVAYTTHNSIMLYFHEGLANNLEVHYQAEGMKGSEVKRQDGKSKYIELSPLKPKTTYNIKLHATYLLTGKSVESDSTKKATQANVLKLHMKKGQESREYSRIQDDKSDGRYTWLCTKDKSRIKFKHYAKTSVSRWIIKSANSSIETTSTEQPPVDAPYNADWPSPYQITGILLAKDNRWRPFRKELVDN